MNRRDFFVTAAGALSAAAGLRALPLSLAAATPVSGPVSGPPFSDYMNAICAQLIPRLSGEAAAIHEFRARIAVRDLLRTGDAFFHGGYVIDPRNVAMLVSGRGRNGNDWDDWEVTGYQYLDPERGIQLKVGRHQMQRLTWRRADQPDDKSHIYGRGLEDGIPVPPLPHAVADMRALLPQILEYTNPANGHRLAV